MGLFQNIKNRITYTEENSDGFEELSVIENELNQEASLVPEYAKIELLDTGLLNPKDKVYKFLQEYKINTVGQILDEKLMEDVKKHTTYPENIDYIIRFIKNKYENVTILRTQLLDEKINGDKNISFNIFGLHYNDFNYLETFKKLIDNGIMHNDNTFIDFFRYLISNDSEYLNQLGVDKEIIRLYVSDYDKNKNEFKDDLMEKYSDILLKETGLLKSNSSLYGILKNYNINTVSQILDEGVMFKVKKHVRNVEQLTIFIDIIKNQYLGVPLPQVALFDEPIKSVKHNIDNFYFGTFQRKYYKNATCEDFSFLNNRYVQSYNKGVFIISSFRSALEFAYHFGYLDDNSTFIDYFKFLISEDNKWLDLSDQDRKILEIYIDEYQKQKNDNLSESQKLEKLKKEVIKLTESRDNLDKQIKEIEMQIKIIEENSKNKGSK